MRKEPSCLIGLEAALSVHASDPHHPVHSSLSRRVTLRELLGRIASPFAVETLPFAPALRPTELCFLLVSHDRPPKVRVRRLYAHRPRFDSRLDDLAGLAKRPERRGLPCTRSRVQGSGTGR